MEKSETAMLEGSPRYQPEGRGHVPVLAYGYPFLVKSVLAQLGDEERDADISLPGIFLAHSLTLVSATEQKESSLSYSPGLQLLHFGPLLENDFCPCL